MYQLPIEKRKEFINEVSEDIAANPKLTDDDIKKLLLEKKGHSVHSTLIAEARILAKTLIEKHEQLKAGAKTLYMSLKDKIRVIETVRGNKVRSGSETATVEVTTEIHSEITKLLS